MRTVLFINAGSDNYIRSFERDDFNPLWTKFFFRRFSGHDLR